MKITLYQNDLPENHKLAKAQSVAIDAESLGLNYKGRDKLCLLQLCSGDEDVFIIQFDRNNYKSPNLGKILKNDNILKIAHYARFEIGIIKHYLDIEIKNIYCTKIASKLCRTYTDKHGLFDITKELYAALDVLYLHRLKEKLDLMLKREKREELAKACFNFLNTRADLDLGGWEEDIFNH
jgi:ribonuclease D